MNHIMILLSSHSLSVKSVARNGDSPVRTTGGWNFREDAPASVRCAYELIYSQYKIHTKGVFFVGAMPKKQTDTMTPPVVREYDIGGTKYIVKATVKPGADEDAAAKVRRLLRKEINGKAEN